MKRVGNVLRNVAAGFLIGIGCVLPGVSGGVMAMSFGLYRPMLDAALHFFDRPLQRLRFLLPLAIGGAAGMAAGAKLLAALMTRYRTEMLYLFIGFILGGVPQLWREAKKGKGSPAALAAGIVLALPLAMGGAGAALENLRPWQQLAAGLLEGVGTVVPGISTSFVLIRLGWYTAYLEILSMPQLLPLCHIALGFGLSALVCMRSVQWLFDHATGHAYFAVLGFLMVSAALVFPGLRTPPLFWADMGLMAIGAVISCWLGRTNTQKE